MQDQDRALAAFENALRHNPNSVIGLNAVASIARARDNFDKAIEYFQRILNIKQDNGEVWGSMGDYLAIPPRYQLNQDSGHCLLMKDDLPKAYTAYQQALYHLPNPKVTATIPLIAYKLTCLAGTETLVWDRYTLRQVRLVRARRRGLLERAQDGS